MKFSWIEANNPIAFPALGWEFDPPLGFAFGSINIRFYGVIIAIGLLLAVYYGLKRGKQFGLKQDDILDGVLGIVPFGIICARAYYCIFSWQTFAQDPISVLYIWKGGLAIYGGVIGTAIGVLVYSRIKKIKLGAVLDIVALGFLIGQSIGRWGNFINREAFGSVTESFLRMQITSDITGVRAAYHPTFLYESVWNLVGFVLLHFLSKKRQYDGQIALGYVFWYGLGRALIEGLRMDSLQWGPFRVSQILAAVTCFAAATVLVIQAFRKHDRSKLFVHVAAAREAAALADAQEAAEAAQQAPSAEPEVSEEETAEETQGTSEGPENEASV